jgi:threonine synthase
MSFLWSSTVIPSSVSSRCTQSFPAGSLRNPAVRPWVRLLGLTRWESLSDVVVVSKAELEQATSLMLEPTRNLVEPAGAAAVAAVLRDQTHFA